MPDQNLKPLTEAEQKEYEYLENIYERAGGNPDKPLDNTTLKLYRGEKEKQPEDTINPEQVDRLRKLHKKRIGEILPE